MNILGKEVAVSCQMPSSLIEAVVERLSKQPFDEVADLIPPLIRSLREAESEAMRTYVGEVRHDAVAKHIETEAKVTKARAAVPDVESPGELARIEKRAAE